MHKDIIRLIKEERTHTSMQFVEIKCMRHEGSSLAGRNHRGVISKEGYN